MSIRDRIVFEAFSRGVGINDSQWHELSNTEKRRGLHRLSFLADEFEITQEQLCGQLVDLMIANRVQHHDSLSEDQLIEHEILDIEARQRYEDAAERSTSAWLSWAACNRIVRRLRLRHAPIPEPLKDWSVPEPQKPRNLRNELLNELVAACVRVGSESGLNVYRNEITPVASVIDVVAERLNAHDIANSRGQPFNYESVRKIMNRRWDK